MTSISRPGLFLLSLSLCTLGGAAEPNRLIHEQSPYLRQHAHNPVDWYPWGEAAFAKAQAENKPIFLSIGYSTCHWCHVMADESFADEATAAILNDHFVAIKVDREERPDVDHIYMTFVQAATGHGGWPLNVWLTPERKPFFGGTYFPPTDQGGRPSFSTVLNHLSGLWKQDSARVRDQSEQMLVALSADLAPAVSADAVPWNALREAALDRLGQTYDPRFAGFGSGPKFPNGPNLELLVDLAASHPDATQRAHALEMLTATLQAITSQGMHDHVGGGFHRYTVDGEWRVPHFEKMLYDQAQITSLLLSAWQLTGREEFRDAATTTLDYVQAELTHSDGGFYSAEDAVSLPTIDASHKVEGAFYTWTADQLTEILPAGNRDLFNSAYGIENDGNVAANHNSRGELTNQNILRRARTNAELAESFDLILTEVETRLTQSLERLHTTRESRPRPHLDDKIVTAWNGLMISAYARAGQVLDDPHHTAIAQRAAHFLRNQAYDEATGTLARSTRNGQRNALGFAEDYALLIQGLLDLYEADFDTSWLEWALALQEKQIELFEDPATGGFFASNPDDESIIMRVKKEHDSAEPAATSVSVRNLGRLAALLHDDALLAQAQKSAKSMAVVIERSPTALPQLLAAVSWLNGDAQQALIQTGAEDASTANLLTEIRGRFHPRRMVVRIDAESRAFFEARVPFIAGLPDEQPESATAYICENFVCQMPTSNRAELAKILDRAKR